MLAEARADLTGEAAGPLAPTKIKPSLNSGRAMCWKRETSWRSRRQSPSSVSAGDPLCVIPERYDLRDR